MTPTRGSASRASYALTRCLRQDSLAPIRDTYVRARNARGCARRCGDGPSRSGSRHRSSAEPDRVQQRRSRSACPRDRRAIAAAGRRAGSTGLRQHGGRPPVSPRLLETTSQPRARSVDSRSAIARSAPLKQFKIPTGLVQDDRASDDLPFGSRGGISIPYQFPLDGEYRIKVLLKRQLYLYLIGMGDRTRSTSAWMAG